MKNKISLIGLGNWGKNYLRTLSQLNLLRSIYDPKIKDTNSNRKRFNIPKSVIIENSLKSLVSDQKVTACIIASPPKFHYENLVMCLKSKKHCLVEKPLFTKNENFSLIKKLIKKNNLIFMVGHLLNYHDGVNKLIDIVTDKKFGKIKYVISQRLNLGKFRKDENIISSFAPHDISLILRISKNLPKKIICSNIRISNNYVYDISNSILKFDSFNSYINVSWLHPEKIHKFIVYSEKNIIEFDSNLEKDRLLKITKIPSFNNNYNLNINKKVKFIKYNNSEPLKNQVLHFTNSIKNNTIPLTDFEEAQNVHKVLMKMSKK